MSNLKIHTLAYVEMVDLGGLGDLYSFDLKLTVIGDGMSLYSKEETLAEVRRHHEEDASNFGDLIEAIEQVPDGVMFSF